MRKIVIGLSGGMDSTTLLAYFLEANYEVHCCTFTYGSKHNQYENKAAFQLIEFYRAGGEYVHHHFFDLSEAFKNFNSNLLKSGGEIPEGHYEGENMKLTVVPGRNLIFASIMAGLAESIGAEAIALGIHSGDHAIYPDCRPEFATALQQVLDASTEGKIKVKTPFLNMNKATILQTGYAMSLRVPYELTRTCYKDQELCCGKCGSCRERLEAFGELGIKDPAQYE